MRPAHTVLAVAALFFLGGATFIDPGEVHCEEAVNHLDDCCHAPINRDYSCTAGRGCDPGRPDLDDPLATQIRDESCAQLVASGACEMPPKSPVPPPECGDSWGEPRCNDASVTPPDLATHDLASPADLSDLDGSIGDGSTGDGS